jgi:hypothetical protein
VSAVDKTIQLAPSVVEGVEAIVVRGIVWHTAASLSRFLDDPPAEDFMRIVMLLE